MTAAMSTEGPSQGANSAPLGAANAVSVGVKAGLCGKSSFARSTDLRTSTWAVCTLRTR